MTFSRRRLYVSFFLMRAGHCGHEVTEPRSCDMDVKHIAKEVPQKGVVVPEEGIRILVVVA